MHDPSSITSAIFTIRQSVFSSGIWLTEVACHFKSSLFFWISEMADLWNIPYETMCTDKDKI